MGLVDLKVIALMLVLAEKHICMRPVGDVSASIIAILHRDFAHIFRHKTPTQCSSEICRATVRIIELLIDQQSAWTMLLGTIRVTKWMTDGKCYHPGCVVRKRERGTGLWGQ